MTKKRSKTRINPRTLATVSSATAVGTDTVSPLLGSQPSEERTDSQSAEPGTDQSPSCKRGRRPGTKNVKRDEVDVQVPRCKCCGSTRRQPYGQPIVQIAAGTNVQGEPFTHVVARPTACLDCGQARRDVSYENHPKLTADQLHAKLCRKNKTTR